MRRLLFVLLLAPAAALAQDLSTLSPNANSVMPQCGPAMDGLAICRFGVIYECEFISPNGLDRHSGWRWTKDVLRSCPSAPAAADLPGNGQGGPAARSHLRSAVWQLSSQSGGYSGQPLPNQDRPGGATSDAARRLGRRVRLSGRVSPGRGSRRCLAPRRLRKSGRCPAVRPYRARCVAKPDPPRLSVPAPLSPASLRRLS